MGILTASSEHVLHVLTSLWQNPSAGLSHLSLAPSQINEPLLTAAVYLFAIALACWVLSVLTFNFSWVDRVWSLAPILYAYIFAAKDIVQLATGREVEWRLILGFVVILIWGLRLSFNFYRKGGYNPKDEDYRWAVLRSKMHPALFQVFNVLFIAVYQNVLLWLNTLPLYYIYQHRLQVPFGIVDYLLVFAIFSFIFLETVADEQQWDFHQAKHATKSKSFPKFLTEGLWRYSRHPNFFFEQSVWVGVYTLSAAVSYNLRGSIINWSGVGAFLLVLLFQGSTAFTESITLKKYPPYTQYQKTTSRLIPWISSKQVKHA